LNIEYRLTNTELNIEQLNIRSDEQWLKRSELMNNEHRMNIEYRTDE